MPKTENEVELWALKAAFWEVTFSKLSSQSQIVPRTYDPENNKFSKIISLPLVFKNVIRKNSNRFPISLETSPRNIAVSSITLVNDELLQKRNILIIS